MKYCKDGNFAGVYACIRNGIDLEQRDKSHQNFTGLMHACLNGHKNVFDLLIYYQVDIHAKDDKQNNALIYTSYYGGLEILEKLV